MLIGLMKENKIFFLSPQTDAPHIGSMNIFPIWEQPSPILHFQAKASDGIRHRYLITHLHGRYLTFQHQKSLKSALPQNRRRISSLDQSAPGGIKV